MQDPADPKHESPEEAAEAMVLDESWGLPLPPRRSHRREFQLLTVALVLLGLFCVVRWRSSGGLPKEPPGMLKPALTQTAKTVPEVKKTASATAPSLADAIVYLTFEPETLESAKFFTVVKDVSGRGHHGILYGAKPAEKGRVGGGVSLVGIDDACVELPTLKCLDPNSRAPRTISLWTYETRYHRDNSLWLWGQPDRTFFGMVLARSTANRRYSFRVAFHNDLQSAEEYGAREWHHVVGVCSEQGLEMFVDGRSVATQAWQAPMARNGPRDPDVFGAYLGRGYEGILDEVLVFQRALPAEEIAALYQMGLAGRRPPPPVPSPSLGSFLARRDELLTAEGKLFRENFHGGTHGRLRAPPVDSCRLTQESYSLAPDGESLLVGNRWGWCSQEYFDGRRPVTERVQALGACLHGLTPSPDGKRVACYGGTGRINLWDRTKAATAARLDTTLEAVAAVGFSADGALLAAAGRVAVNDQEKGPVGLWDAKTFKEVRRFLLPGLEATAGAISPDGTRILAACLRDKQIYLFDAKTGRSLRTFPANAEEVTCLKFLPDSRRFLSAGDANWLSFWDSQTGKPIGELHRHTGKVTCLDVSRDGQRAISGSKDGAVCVWSMQPTSNPRVFIHGRYQVGYPLRHVAFVDDGREVAFGTVYGDFYRLRGPRLAVAPAPPVPLTKP